jgi:phospholipase/lecithinase/hemolysin
VLKNPASPGPAPTVGDGGTSLAPYSGSKTALNNWGVPGVTIQTAQTPLLGGPSSANPLFNPFYARIASAPGTSTLIGDAVASLASGGTFFTFWLGNNDVLGYATGGASNPAILTAQPTFQAAYNAALTALLNAKADTKGAVANVPNITSIPFFTTVPVNPVTLPAANATALNAAFGGYNATLDALKGSPFNLPAAEMDGRKISYTTGAGNRVIINDETARDLGPLWDQLEGAGAINSTQRAQLEPYRFARKAIVTTSAVVGDLVILPAASFIGTLVGGNPQLINGLTIPLADNWVLIPSEQTQIQTSIDGFNTTIAAAVAAQPERLVLVDTNTLLKNVRAGGVTVGGSSLSASLSPPFGAFSTDGVHPNPRGSAYIANQFILAINAKWGSKIPLCNPNDFIGNALPTP